MGRTSLMAILNATYSAAVELRVWSVCSLLDHRMGQPKRVRVTQFWTNTDWVLIILMAPQASEVGIYIAI